MCNIFQNNLTFVNILLISLYDSSPNYKLGMLRFRVKQELFHFINCSYNPTSDNQSINLQNYDHIIIMSIIWSQSQDPKMYYLPTSIQGWKTSHKIVHHVCRNMVRASPSVHIACRYVSVGSNWLETTYTVPVVEDMVTFLLKIA